MPVGELGQGKDGGRRERKREKHTKKWLEKRKNLIWITSNPLGSSKPVKKEEKLEGEGGGSVRENGCSHAQHKKSKFFFEFFRMENFTLRIFQVHRKVHRAAFDSWSRNTTQTSVEGLQDGLPHKSEGERDILQAFQQSL